jgi:hypothetical protein
LLKRAIKGTYVSVEAFHLFRYLDEQCFPFNNRKMTDAERFAHAAAAIVGKRLTYKDSLAPNSQKVARTKRAKPQLKRGRKRTR